MKCMIAVCAAALAFAAMAQDPTMRRNPNPAGAINPVVRAALNPKLAEKLGITEEQSAKLKALNAEKDGLKELNEKIRRGMERQAELLKADKVDEAAVMAALDEVWETRKEVAKRQTKRIIAVKSILTPEQVAKAREAIKSIGKGGCRKGRGEGREKKPAAGAEAQ